MRDPLAGFCACGLVYFCNRLARRLTPGWGLLALACLLGLGHAWLRLPAVPPDRPWLDERGKGLITGRVSVVAEKPGDRIEILLDQAWFSRGGDIHEELPGRVDWTWQDPAFRPMPGQEVSFPGRPRSTTGFVNPGGVDWAWLGRLRGVNYRAFTQGPAGVDVTRQAPDDPLENWRLRLRQAILDGAGPGSAGGMVLGLVTGEFYAMSLKDIDMVRRANLAHLLAVSGMNLAAVVAMGWGLAWLAGLVWPGLYLRLPRPKLAVLFGLPLVCAYLWLGRFAPSLVRAALMFAAWGALLFFNRPRILLDGLFLALAAMLLADPLCAFDVALQLSAAAVAGLTLLMPLAWPVLARLGRLPRPLARWAKFLGAWFLVTLAAQLAVLPVQAQVFGEVGWHLYLFMLWVPVIEWLASPLAYLGALTVMWWPWVANHLLAGAARVCSWMLASLSSMDQTGLLEAMPVFRPWWPELLGYVIFLGGAAYGLRLSRARAYVWLGLCLALLAGPSVYRAWDQAQERVRLTVMDVGQGQAVLITLPGGERILVDGGGSNFPDHFDIGRRVVAHSLTWGRAPVLAGLAMSHGDTDHAGGLVYPLGHFRLGFMAVGTDLPHGQLRARYQAALAKSGLTPWQWRTGDKVDLGHGLSLEVLNPPDGFAQPGNEASLVLRLVWQGRGLAVIPGDATAGVLQALAESGQDLSAQVLVVAHHGSKSALCPGLYDKIGPKLALVSAGRGNSFGLPHPWVVQSLEAKGIKVFNTARHGGIEARWDCPDCGPKLSLSY